jgi:hypothetical protein
VSLVHHHKGQLGQQAAEVAVEGQDGLMQHVGVGDCIITAAAAAAGGML